MSTSLHTVKLVKGVGVDLFAPTSATPPISAGAAGYIQNIGNTDVALSDTMAFESNLLLTGKYHGGIISTLSFSAGDTVFLKTDDTTALLTIAISN